MSEYFEWIMFFSPWKCEATFVGRRKCKGQNFLFTFPYIFFVDTLISCCSNTQLHIYADYVLIYDYYWSTQMKTFLSLITRERWKPFSHYQGCITVYFFLTSFYVGFSHRSFVNLAVGWLIYDLTCQKRDVTVTPRL